MDELFLFTGNIIKERIKLEITNMINPKTKLKVKKRIPKKVKNDSWDKYIGSEIGETVCVCCRKNKINSKEFEAGHIISEFNGGGVNVDNIMPVCGWCNKSMGTENMDEYIENYYPKNYKNFIRQKSR
jgi:hypothetical protein